VYGVEKEKCHQEMRSNKDAECRVNKGSTKGEGGMWEYNVGCESRPRSTNRD